MGKRSSSSYKPQVLTVQEVARKNLENWDRIGAVCGKKDCEYDYGDGTKCVIGMGLSQRTLARVLKDQRDFGEAKKFSQLVKDGIVVPATPRDGDALKMLQYCHDKLCSMNQVKRKNKHYQVEFEKALRSFQKRLMRHAYGQ